MLELYHNNISVCAQKVRLVLAEKGVKWVNHHLDMIKGEHLTPEYLKINPRAVVPTIVHDGRIIIESTVIAEYLDETFPDPPLKPDNPYERAQMRLWSKVCDEGLHMACGSISFASTFARQLARGLTPEQLEDRLNNMPDPNRRERQRQIIRMGFNTPFVRDHVKLYNRTIADMEDTLKKSKWLAGATFSLADISLTPYIERADRLGLGGMWETSCPRVGDWFTRVKQRSSFTAISEFDPVDYDDRIKESANSWAHVKAIIADG
jgi:glutathione S-transferase